MTLPYRQFSVSPGSAVFGHEYTGGTLVETLANFSLVDAALVDGMDEAAKAIAPYSLSIYADNCVPQITDYNLARGIRPNNFAMYNYPVGYPPASGDAVFMSLQTGIGPYVNNDQVDLFNQGIFFKTGNYNPSGPDVEGEKIKSQIGISNIKVYYFNPVVNSFSHYSLRTNEQVEFTISGLAFDQDDTEIDQGGASKPWPGWRSYVTHIEFWHVQAGQGTWEDDFEDGTIDPSWSTEPNNGTIIEAGGVLTLAVANGVNGDWWQPNIKNCPFAYLTPPMQTIEVITKLNSYTVNNNTYAGLMIGNTRDIPDAAGGYALSIGRLRSGGWNGIETVDIGKGRLAYTAMTTLPVWLRMRVQGSGAGSRIDFDYSTDGSNWTNQHTYYNLTWSFIGLYVKNWAAFNAISAPFEFFKYEWGALPVRTLEEALGDFTRDSDEQITIPQNKFPQLSTGTYRLRLKKMSMDPPINAQGFAGAWRSNAGLCTAGAPLEIQVGLMPSIGVRGKAKAVPLMCLTWKNKLGDTYEDCVAPIDTRAPEIFYDGRIIDISSATRQIDHLTGLFNVSDITVRLVNTDKKYSKLLANWFLKNQACNLWYATGFEPESSKTQVCGMIVDDYHLQGTQFVIKLKDITEKYFKKKVPPRICTDLTFPQIHPDSIGKAFPEVLGLCVLGTAFEHPGAVQAIYTDTLVYEYLAANGTITVTEVYSDDVLQSTPADYSIVYHDGLTFIDFTADQGDKKITFNAQGYSVGGLNSVNGYIQNPAYIIYYFLNNILDVPTELLNVPSFTELASKYDDLGVGESGKLILQTRQDSMEVLRQLFFTYGTHGFTANDGKFMVARKDIYNYATETFLFDQIDLMDAPLREFNLVNAINTVKARWDYIPWQRLWKDAREDYKDNKFEAIMEDDITLPREKFEPRREEL